MAKRVGLKSSKSPHFDISNKEIKEILDLPGSEARKVIENNYNGLTGICKQLKTSPNEGLTGEDFDVRIHTFGINYIPPKKPKSFIRLAWEALHDVTLIILMVAALLSLGISFYKGPEDSEASAGNESESEAGWIEGLAIFIAVIVVVLVTAFNDWQKERQFRGLKSKIENEHKFSVIRSTDIKQVPVADIVVGDICLVKYGDLLPADGLIIQSNDLKVDESSLTGESDHVKKSENHDPILFSGTHVMEGSGKMVVVAVGINSKTGRIFKLLGATQEEKKKKKSKKNKKSTVKNEEAEEVEESLTSKSDYDDDSDHKDLSSNDKQRSVLQSKLTKLALRIGYFGIIVAVLTILILIIRFCIETFVVEKNSWKNKYIHNFIQFIIIGVTVLVVAVPEGLPLAVTLALAYSVRKMMYDNNLVRHLDACETMGNATAICSDKTGTLTTNRMTVVEVWVLGKYYKAIPKAGDIGKMQMRLLAMAISINSGYTSKIVPSEGNKLAMQMGNKTECALLGFLLNLGVDYKKIRQEFPEETLHKVYTFNSIRKSMTTIIKNKEQNGFILFTKGASEILLSKCTWFLDKTGQTQQFTQEIQNKILQTVITSMAVNGMRTICIAYKKLNFG